MADTKVLPLTEASPSVQTHLGILQGMILRMTTNSSQCKTWCITLVSAILVIIADKSKPELVWIALFPTLVFCALDAYYLALEKAFRATYHEFVQKMHNQQLQPQDLYAVAPSGSAIRHRIAALGSYSVWGFYLGLVLLVVLGWFFVLGNQ